MHFRNKDIDRSNMDICIGTEKLEYVTEYKYLGILLNEYMNYDTSVDTLANAAGRSLGAVFNKFKVIKNMNIKTFNKMVDSYVTPVLHYSAGIWGFKEYKKCDQVLYKAARFYLGVHKFAPIVGMLGDLEWLPTQFNRWLDMLRWWNHVITLENNRWTKKVFLYDYDICKANWCSEVKKIFNKLNMMEYYNNQEICNLTLAKEKFKELYVTEWQNKVDSSAKLRVYKTFKTVFKLESYVSLGLSRSHRSALAQLRLGILPIHIETGRFTNKTIEERLCTVCNNNCVEDEYHFVLHCSAYNGLRDNCLKNIMEKIVNFDNMTDKEKLFEIMSEGYIKLAKFTSEAFNLRKSLLSVET